MDPTQQEGAFGWRITRKNNCKNDELWINVVTHLTNPAPEKMNSQTEELTADSCAEKGLFVSSVWGLNSTYVRRN